MNLFLPLHPRASSNIKRFQNCDRHRRRQRKSVAFSFVVVSVLWTSLYITRYRVFAHDMKRCTQMYSTSTNYNDRGKRKRSYNRSWKCLRGGANRFVNDDGNEYNYEDNIDENNIVGSGSYNNPYGANVANKNSKGQKKHSPVVYQYFGKSRSRGGPRFLGKFGSEHSNTDDATLNFILLGPNVDHWKTVGQTLASRGFNVMACERMVENQNNGGGNAAYVDATMYDDAPELVLEILDALKWDKAVLVGCDNESLLAIETSMMLAPHRIAGLILCGDLTRANRFAEETGGIPVLDSFLHQVLDCPFVIVDGGARSIVSGSSAHEAIETKSSPFGGDGGDGRCVILGGGSAPHRIKPEYFSWVLARFVEEKLEYHSMEYAANKRRLETSESSIYGDLVGRKFKVGIGGILKNLNLPFGINSLVSPEGRLLLGRAVAAAIFYTSIMKVIFVQCGIIRMGFISIKNSVDSVGALRRKIFQAIGAFVVNFGYVPRLLKFSSKKTKELDDDEEKEKDEDTSDEDTSNEDTSDLSSSLNENETEDLPEEGEDEDHEEGFRIKPLFFLDNIFT